MLRSMTSAELTEWMAYYQVKQEDEDEARTGRKVWKPPETE